jgi:DNA-binding NarL/FixJ family response regulator
LLRDGLRALFASVSDIEVVGEAATGDEVIGKADQLQPDVILMDIQMPGVNGIQATRLVNFFSSPQSGLSPQAFPELTARERKVLDLIAKGLNNQAIANRLSISEKTVRNHISIIATQP